ncbi:MAG: GGDEF domain-containing protein, partial [Myxococcales bacterium]
SSIATGRPVAMDDVLDDASDPRTRAARQAGLHGGFAFPVLVGRDVAAVLELYSGRAGAIDPGLLDVVRQVGTQLGRVIERERARVALERHAAEIQALSLRDELTGLNNRRGFLTLAAQQLKHIDRAGGRALLFFADLNGMKLINDTFGHDVGDEALRALARALEATFRDADVLARLGGDEFVVLAHSAGTDTVEALTARLQANVARHNATTGERPFRLSVSCGAALYDGRQPRALDALLAEADARMYEQKRVRRSARTSGQVSSVPTEETGARMPPSARGAAGEGTGLLPGSRR